MTKKKREIYVDQLYRDDTFLSYCNYDQHGGVSTKLGERITPEFLLACEKDDFILPLHTQTETRMVNGKELQVEAKYYSPFQLFLVAELCKNTIDEDGLLRDVDLMDATYQKEQKARYINWGGESAFLIDDKKRNDLDTFPMYNHFALMKNFHCFLKLLHSFKTFDHSPHDDYSRRRLYRDVPNLQYDFSELDATLLSAYDLDIEKIKTLFKLIGNYAFHIDPLEKWFNYVHKHDVFRKDELKGTAGVAQELYNFCDILREVIETIEGKKLPPFLEFVTSDFPYHNRDKMNQYAEGEDIVAVKRANENLITWIVENTDYIDDIFTKHPEWEKVDFLEVAKNVQKDINDFHERYGDIRYVGMYRTIYPSNKKLEDLDEVTKKYVWMHAKSDDDYDEKLGIEISSAISSRLGDLQRHVSSCAHKISSLLLDDRERIEKEKRMSVGPLQLEYSKERDTATDTNPQLTASLFWRDFLPKAQKKYDDEIKSLENKRAVLHHISAEARYVFCAKCREKYVVLHQMYNDGKLSNEAICDDCISNKDLSTIRSGEWCCEYTNHDGNTCGHMLYKFAHNNILSSILKNTANTKVTLNYGQMEIEISCPKCRRKSSKVVEWGWLA